MDPNDPKDPGDPEATGAPGLRDLLVRARLLPVVTIDDPDLAQGLARALLDGGLTAIEVTLRTPSAVESIRRIADEVPEIVVAAGTVTRPRELAEAHAAGAHFAVSPGLTTDLVMAAIDAPIPLLPGVSSASEALQARDHGWTVLKLFPAEVLGGCRLLRALSGPLPELEFCPTGGIGPEQLRDYLDLPNVLCVGGSWVAPPASIEAKDWEGITRLARQATSVQPTS